MSRGGDFVTNFATRHHDKVTILCGDNRVYNLQSWLGGMSGKHFSKDYRQCFKADGITGTEETPHPQISDQAFTHSLK